jgi:hypothetical protein
MNAALRTFLAVVGTVGAVALAATVPLPHTVRMTRLASLLDLGHFVGFALVALVFWWALSGRKLIALIMAVACAGAVEVGQPMVGRTADPLDFLHGLLGAASAIAFVSLFDRSAGIRRTVAYSLLGLGLAAWPIGQSIPRLVDAWVEYRDFPVLSDFDSPWRTGRWMTVGCKVERVRCQNPADAWAGRIDVAAGNRACLLVLVPLMADWTAQERLFCEFTVDGGDVPIAILLRTGRGREKRITSLFRKDCTEGEYDIEADLRPSPVSSRLSPQLSHVHSLYLQIGPATRPATLYLHRVYLG